MDVVISARAAIRAWMDLAGKRADIIAALRAENARLREAPRCRRPQASERERNRRMTGSIWTAPLKGDTRKCTCHPDDNPPIPCQRKYAYSECTAALRTENARLREALRPFAEIPVGAGANDTARAACCVFYTGNQGRDILCGEVRRARAALTP